MKCHYTNNVETAMCSLEGRPSIAIHKLVIKKEIHMYIYIYIYMHTHICMHTFIDVYIYVYIYIYM